MPAADLLVVEDGTNVEYANSYKSIKPSQFPFEEEGSILYKKFDRNQAPLTL